MVKGGRAVERMIKEIKVNFVYISEIRTNLDSYIHIDFVKYVNLPCKSQWEGGGGENVKTIKPSLRDFKNVSC